MKASSTRFGALAVLALFALILLAKPSYALQLRSTEQGETPLRLAATHTLAYDDELAAQIVGNSYLFMGELLHTESSEGVVVPNSMTARFDEVFAVWAPDAVEVLRVERSANSLSYRVYVRTSSTGQCGYFEVNDLSQLPRFLAITTKSKLQASL